MNSEGALHTGSGSSNCKVPRASVGGDAGFILFPHALSIQKVRKADKEERALLSKELGERTAR